MDSNIFDVFHTTAIIFIDAKIIPTLAPESFWHDLVVCDSFIAIKTPCMCPSPDPQNA